MPTRMQMLSLFPRGENIVTRMPIRLHLVHLNNRAAVEALCADFMVDVEARPERLLHARVRRHVATRQSCIPTLYICVRTDSACLPVQGKPLVVDGDGFYLRCAVSERGAPAASIEASPPRAALCTCCLRCVLLQQELSLGPRARAKLLPLHFAPCPSAAPVADPPSVLPVCLRASF